MNCSIVAPVRRLPRELLAETFIRFTKARINLPLRILRILRLRHLPDKVIARLNCASNDGPLLVSLTNLTLLEHFDIDEDIELA